MTSQQDVAETKQRIREQVWSVLDREEVALPPGAVGRIPNFVGAAAAADRLAQLDVWQSAKVIKAVPDRAQLPVRARALHEGKLVYMAVPKLADPKPFYLLDPAVLSEPYEQAARSKVAAGTAPKVGTEDMRTVDLIVCGSVAVNDEGVRIGKGAGYSDIEVALLREAGLISESTTIVTTVHDLQVLEVDLPETEHDFSVDLIVTPTSIITCPRARQRPSGLYWDSLDHAKIAAIPVLQQRGKR